MKRTLTAGTAILFLVVLFVLLNGIFRSSLSSTYLDFTEEGMYSLSSGTVSMLGKLDQPVTLKYYFSRTATADLPALKLYGSRVNDLLREYERVSDGKVVIERFDPRPDTEEEEWAQKFGLEGKQIGTGELLFFGLAGIGVKGKEAAIPFFAQERQEFLEYDITKLIYSLSVDPQNEPAVGVLSSIDVKGAPMNPFAPPGPPAWFFYTQLDELWDVKYLEGEQEKIDDKISLLIVIHPKELSQTTLFAIDQFVLKGGKLLVLVDPFCEADQPSKEDENSAAAFSRDRSSHLNQLLTKWGVTLEPNKVVGDISAATAVNTGETREPKQFLIWLSLNRNAVISSDDGRVLGRIDYFNNEDIITGAVDSVLLPWSGNLNVAAPEGVSISPLLQSSEGAMLVEDKDYRFNGGNPDKLLQDYQPGNKVLPLAVRIRGKLKTNFEGGKPEKSGSASETETKAEAMSVAPSGEFLKESIGESNVIVVADVDFISDRYSVAAQNFFGTKVFSLLNDNQNLLQNMVENLMGSDDLIALRSRGRFTRPFEKVAAIEREAAAKWKQQEQALQFKLNAANQSLNELQRSARGKEGQEGAQQVFDKAVLEQIKKFRAEKVEIMANLRDVRRRLREDKERLGEYLFFLNTFIMPLFLISFTAGVAMLRGRRKRSANG